MLKSILNQFNIVFIFIIFLCYPVHTTPFSFGGKLLTSQVPSYLEPVSSVKLPAACSPCLPAHSLCYGFLMGLQADQ